jgi:proteasome lid subunit RPN8/RPN11
MSTSPYVLAASPALAESIRRHGAETYPHECCGAVLGREAAGGLSVAMREAVALFPLVNRRDDSPRNRFSVTPEDVLAAEQAARRQSLELIGWYHSHPDHPARPSEYDREHAWPWYSYIIVSVEQGVPKEMTSWRLDDDRAQFWPEELKLQDAAAGPARS